MLDTRERGFQNPSIATQRSWQTLQFRESPIHSPDFSGSGARTFDNDFRVAG